MLSWRMINRTGQASQISNDSFDYLCVEIKLGAYQSIPTELSEHESRSFSYGGLQL